MTINEYQEKAQRTSSTKTPTHKLTNACLGLAGETGEVCDLLKKALFQGHELDADKLIEEAGDCAWYLAELAAALDIAKLEKRYPDGFDAERSRHRPEYKIGENQA